MPYGPLAWKGSFTLLLFINVDKDGETDRDITIEILKARGVFTTLGNVWKSILQLLPNLKYLARYQVSSFIWICNMQNN